MKKNPRIAIIMAVYNRWHLTSNLLSQLSVPNDHFNLSIYVVDDGSNDETKELLPRFPLINYVRTDGNLFWAKSMKIAESLITEEIDYILWLNNDVKLESHFFQELNSAVNLFPSSILVGQTCDPVSRKLTYGGFARRGRHPHRLLPVTSTYEYVDVDTFSGNMVLIPNEIYVALSGIEGRYQHGYADYDFGYRAKKMGFSIRLVPGFLGTCQRNEDSLVGKSPFRALHMLMSTKYLPIKSQIRFCFRHGGIEWPIYVLYPYLRTLFGMNKFKSNQINADY
jgi:GT2 family glycosyltransferase